MLHPLIDDASNMVIGEGVVHRFAVSAESCDTQRQDSGRVLGLCAKNTTGKSPKTEVSVFVKRVRRLT